MHYHLWERVQDWVYLAVCLAVAFVLLLTRNEPLVRTLRAASLDATSGLEARLAGAGRYLRALDENERLVRENERLAALAARSREAVVENDRLRALIGFRDSSAAEVRAVRIIGRTLGGGQNLLTIDAGAADGVRENMPVLDERGVLGRVVLASAHYARVMPYLHEGFRIVGRIQDLGADGIVRWTGEGDRLLLEHVARTEPVRRGMLVVTGGASGVFPAGFPIGTVADIRAGEGRNALEIDLKPAAPLGQTTHAFVVLAVPDSERVALEAQPVR